MLLIFWLETLIIGRRNGGRLGESDEYFWKTPNEKEKEIKKEISNKEVTKQVPAEDASDSVPEGVYGDDLASLISHWKEHAPDQRLDGEAWEENMRKALGTKFDR